MPFEPQDFPAPTRRRRLLVALLAVSTALTMGWLMIYRVGAPQRVPPPPPADAARCKTGQLDACVGGRALVISMPPPVSASAPAPGVQR
jgi:hypothetical protein